MTQTINPEDLFKQLNNKDSGIRCLDVRRDDEVAQGMIPTADHIPLSLLSEQYTQLDKALTWVIYCKRGGRSLKACVFLESKGYQVVNLTGGYDAFKVLGSSGDGHLD